MAIEVFNRYENKYMLSEDTLEKVQRELTAYMEPDPYNKQNETYTISNLYYDTQDNHLIRTSLQKPKYKEKLRLRAYGVPNEDTNVYAEIKKKFRGLVNKRRSTVKLNEAYEFLQTGIIPDEKPYQNRQVLREIAYILDTHDLHPALYIAYDRKAYFGVGQHDLRISFDTNIRTRRFDLTLESGDYGKLLLPQEQWLMEIKSSQSIPVWLSKLLSEYKIYPTSFSKYGAEYTRMLESEKPQIIYTLVPEKAASLFRPAVSA
jgi:SPX domain protein involved in polyphosphate accumulation